MKYIFRKQRLFCLISFFACSFFVKAQETFPYNGVKDDKEATVYALTNATIVVDPDTVLEKAVLIVSRQKIVDVGVNIDIPENAIVLDFSNHRIYPSFIDMSSTLGMPAVKKGSPFQMDNYFVSRKEGPYYWNEHVAPEVSSVDVLDDKKIKAKPYLSAGIGVVNTSIPDGVLRGRSVVVVLSDKAHHHKIVKTDATMQFSFERGHSSQTYPTSKMGMVALIKQFWEDVRWYKSGNKQELNLSLSAYIEHENIPHVFNISNELEIGNVLDLSKAYNRPFVIVGNGKTYSALDILKNHKPNMVVPVQFPLPFDLSNPYISNDVSYRDLKHWEVAPHNPAILSKNGISIAITSSGQPKDFLKGLRKAVRYGLSEQKALEALTANPSQWLGVSSHIGSIEKGKMANFFISDKNIFEEKANIIEHWVLGERNILKPVPEADLEGVYELTLKEDKIRMDVTKKKEAYTFSFHADSVKLKHDKLSFKKNRLSFFLKADSGKVSNTSVEGRFEKSKEGVVFTGHANQNFTSLFTVKAAKQTKVEQQTQTTEEPKSEEKKKIHPFENVPKPFEAYGFYDSVPSDNNFIITNATVWTNEEEGVLENTDILVLKGKIHKVGKDLKASDSFLKIDGTGKHITAGIIDEHAHIAIRGGVNECSQAVTAEVSIEDSIDSNDIDIYHSLAGGVVAAQLLHGSCNPIGGRSAIIKLKWGATPNEMKIKGATPFIKFALGENVKKSNWGNGFTARFPQTRMGVEQVYDYAFARTLEYEKKILSGKPYRKDFELEALLEILKKKRFVSCHSYVQSEINMLMKMAEKYGFRINTFTHILEGYKVADLMREHGAAASTFSDWWSYKFEVKDAIAYNAALMHQQGVLTAINSDDSEMMRRLNQEAAKVVKYGNVSEEDALKMVTLNPAKILHLDDRMGSIKSGKEANIVVWSGHPMSVYSKAEKTIIDGQIYFDIERDKKLRAFYENERSRIMNLMAEEVASGSPSVPPVKEHKKRYHCDDK